MLQAAQLRGEVVVVVVVAVDVVVVVAFGSSSILRTLIAPSFPSFAAFVHHSRVRSND